MSDTFNAPIGAEPVNTQTENQSNTTPNPASEPQAIELKDDSLVRIPGVDKPVKWTDHVRGFQSQATKASQRAAELERKYNEAQQAIQRYEQQQRQAQAQQQPQQNPQGDFIGKLRSEPYLTGDMAAKVVENIITELNTRDQYTLAMLKEMKRLRDIVGGLNETSVMSGFDQKIGKWLDEGGYPKEYADLAKEIYLAYEGDDLDNEFPQIFKARVEQIEAAFEAKRRQAADAARKAPFVPGKGGTATPNKPLSLKVGNSAREDAEALWESMQFGQGT